MENLVFTDDALWLRALPSFALAHPPPDTQPLSLWQHLPPLVARLLTLAALCCYVAVSLVPLARAGKGAVALSDLWPLGGGGECG